MNESIVLTLFSTLTAISIIGFYVWTKAYARMMHEKFSFKKHFPYELMMMLKGYQRPYFQLIYLLISVGWLVFYWLIFPLAGSSWIIPLLIVLMMLLIMFYFLMTIRSIPVERFVFISSIVHMLSIVFPLIIAFFSWTSPFDRFTTFLYWISFVQAMTLIGLLFIPSLKTWSLLQEKKSEQGIKFDRPKVFILALYQWIYIFSFYFLNLMILIEFFI